MTTSAEFVQLCRNQLSLTANLGASLSVVYLTEAWVDEEPKKLIPIAAYPDTALDDLDTPRLMSLPQTASLPPLLAAQPPLSRGETPPIVDIDFLREPELEPELRSTPQNEWEQDRQAVLPLIDEGVVMGFLVTGRNDRPWNAQEHQQLSAIAHTLALACLLDHRSQWMSQQLARNQHLQAEQSNTLHNLLHQLKSPLTALHTFGKLLLKRLLPDDRNYSIANSILQQSDRIQELLEQVDQTLERTETSLSLPPTVDSVPVEVDEQADHTSVLALLPASEQLEPMILTEVLEPLLTSAIAIAEERQLQCQIDLPASLPPVLGNRKALREVLSNLIDNALKYTPSGGKIYIGAKLTARSAQQNQKPSRTRQVGIAISDTGPGIPPQDLEHLFERHYRGRQAESDIPGTGLGLAIAMALVQKMQSEIQVCSPIDPEWASKDMLSSISIHPGTTFILWLKPIKPSKSPSISSK